MELILALYQTAQACGAPEELPFRQDPTLRRLGVKLAQAVFVDCDEVGDGEELFAHVVAIYTYYPKGGNAIKSESCLLEKAPKVPEENFRVNIGSTKFKLDCPNLPN